MAHRKADVDIDDEDQFYDEAEAAAPVAELEAALAAKTADVRALLSRGNVAAALQTALNEPVYGGRDVDSIKERTLQLVMEALAATRPADIAGVVAELRPGQLDVLLKYVYGGMARPDLFNSALLLSWHEKAYEVGGLGAIVRVLTDRRAV
ncbi:arp2/3 complex subunit [Polyrhizophydium stewartii]|uniref:Actin-related protein 2/3 complex subunit 5 n=1 Tax=Polyrhizophydium stewartii TaxID=2732419 RepID=A0ABR4NKB5_9FUNG